jgi:putative membrane protein
MAHMIWDGGWYGVIFGPLLMVLVLAVVIVVAVLIVRALGGPGQWASPPHYPSLGRNPMDILRERLPGARLIRTNSKNAAARSKTEPAP